MAKYLFFRFASMFPLLALTIFIVYFLGHMAPGDPITNMYRDLDRTDAMAYEVSQDFIDAQKAKWGLDRPFLVQYVDYMGEIFRGNLGVSIAKGGVPVADLLSKGLVISAQLGIWGFVMLVVVGLPLGTIAALRHNTRLDYLIVGGTLFINALPVYVIAPLTMMLLVLQLKIMSVPYGFEGMFNPKVIMPAFFMGLGPLATVIRQTRVGVLEVMSFDYVRTARAKGLHERSIVVWHVLRTGLIPVTTTLGMILASMLTGALYVERIFGIGGYGRLTQTGYSMNDIPVLLGTTIVGAFLVMGANLLADIIYPFLDPRVAYT